MSDPLKAPFPYFGGKSKIAAEVWQRFGGADNYVEPFAGSLAMLLANPNPPAIETVNDMDGYLVNFWRALKADPYQTAWYADYPVSEIDLHARHIWLVNQRGAMLEQLEADPEWYDPKMAGWWVWGACSWIGGGWCSGEGPWQVIDGKFVDTRQRPHLGNAGQGVNRKRPHLAAGQGVNRKRPHLGNAGRGVNRQRPHLGDAGRGGIDIAAGVLKPDLYAYFEDLAERLRNVRICYGDWTRVTGPTPTFKRGTTAVFLDPPYNREVNDRVDCYNHETDVSVAVGEWCRENGDNPLLKIALCGYEGEYDLPGWECWEWTANGGYSTQRKNGVNDNKYLERVWFSPACIKVVKQAELFSLPVNGNGNGRQPALV